MDNDDIDITQDLVDGSDGSLGDAQPVNTNGLVQQNENGAELRSNDGSVPVNQVEKPEKTEEFSLRDQLSNAFKGEPAKDDKPAVELTKDAEGKWRTADGLFASKEQVAAFEAKQAADANAQQQQQQPQDNNAQQQQAPAFLQRMTPLEQQQFQALPAETREFIGRTMEAVEGEAAKYSEYGLIEQQLIGPRREAWAANGLTPAVALNQLFALSDFATRDPKGFVLYFADQHKIDLDAALDERDALAQNQDPRLAALQSQVQQLQTHFQQQFTEQQTVQYNESLNSVKTFAEEKDEAGSLKRPHLTDVMDAWVVQIQATRQANPNMPTNEVLQKAYETACWANPAVRSKMQEADAEARRKEATRKVEQARLAASSVNGAPAGGGAPNNSRGSEGLSVRESLKQAFAEHATA